MPRLVVPILAPSPAESSRCASSSRCRDRISGAFSAILKFAGEISTPWAAQPLDFLDEKMRIDDDAIADDRQLAGPHDARGQQRQLIGHAVDDQRMAGIVAALKPHHHIGLDATANRRSCPCLRRPIGRRPPPHSPWLHVFFSMSAKSKSPGGNAGARYRAALTHEGAAVKAGSPRATLAARARRVVDPRLPLEIPRRATVVTSRASRNEHGHAQYRSGRRPRRASLSGELPQ